MIGHVLVLSRLTTEPLQNFPAPRPASVFVSDNLLASASASDHVTKSQKLRLTRQGRPPTRPLGRARWRRTLRTQTSERFSQQLCSLPSTSPPFRRWLITFGASACYAGNQQTPTCWR